MHEGVGTARPHKPTVGRSVASGDEPSPPLAATASCALAAVIGFLVFPGLTLRGQTSAPPAIDPMMSLMLAQPRMEFNAPIVPEVSFDPPVVRVGETAVYRVVLNALEDSIPWPETLAAPPQLELRRGGHGQVLQMLGTNMQPRTTFSYRVKAKAVGQFVLPAFKFQVYGKEVTVPAAALSVVQNPPAGLPPAQFLELEVSSTNLFVGQPVQARVVMPNGPGGEIQGLSQVQFQGQGFLVDQSSVRQTVRIQQQPGRASGVPRFIYETLLTPIQAGTISLFAQGYTVGNRFGGPVVITGPAVILGGQPAYTLLDSDPVELRVKPLPAHGKLPGFTGAIGALHLEGATLSTNRFRVGDPIRLQVRVLGAGNLGRLVPPPAPLSRDWQIFSANEASPPPQAAQSLGFATLTYTLIALSDEVTQTPEIPFSFFDPVQERYRNLSIPGIPVEVESGSMAVDTQALEQAAALPSRTNSGPKLSDLASSPGPGAASLRPLQQQPWFPAVQAAPALFFLGLYGWDRRRRFLENHPEIVLCRRARRALRRERRAMDRAASGRRAEQFARSAVKAMQVACAPHYPAEPRALVGRDVLELLPDTERSNGAGEAVKKLFALADQAEFAGTPRPLEEVFLLRPALDRVLEALDGRLKI